MKIVILAGGFGTRLSEETILKPKPMINIGDHPIIWHIMKIYSNYGFNEFVICLGYKGYVIKEYFANYMLHQSDIVFDMQDNSVTYLNNKTEKWKISLIDTGLNTMTGGRIKRIKNIIGKERFMLTYGDGVGNININSLLEFHKKSKVIATLTATKPFGRFGTIQLDDTDVVTSFQEKPEDEGSWINGGFFVFEPEIFDFIENDNTILEREPLEMLSGKGQLAAYKHNGFWRAMDSLRDKKTLEDYWETGNAPWKIW
ncbi:MAG: glucose-1-phosphate cytidylyltransferase [Bacteroidetes bacterium GWF2_38_335]|nr:MAG: glucose-1-phosphate cytidylyltransferase [Bacteroidetes bacterium GWF2_38_335]OFY76941.1 MAG: glucose-1-phosphate cytidylyltransferase [Bacteroidetes bacterium RIFOXYA12_FULL_38_20]HBS86793.1 glucose-1-phosphate cytidylyltransferase [Bacteroidales bacterium]